MNLQILKNVSLFILTQECADRYFDDFDILHTECFKANLSKGLGISMILGSLFVKVPQILKILHSRSVEGINIISVLMDLFGTFALSSYSYSNKFPFSAWGDSVFLSLQCLMIVTLVIYDFKHILRVTAFLALYASLVVSVITGVTPKHILWSCQAITTPVVVTGKFLQAYTNYKNGSTGQLSAITCFLLLFGSLARIFTSIQETGDKSMIILYTFSSIGNIVLVGQLLYYWNVKITKKEFSKKQN